MILWYLDWTGTRTRTETIQRKVAMFLRSTHLLGNKFFMQLTRVRPSDIQR